MKLVFCAQTALDLCSRLAAEQARIAQPCRMRSLAGCASAARDIDRMNLSPVTDLIGKDFLKPSKHILVSGDSHRFRSREYVRHTWGGAFPNMSFYQIADDVFVTSPELSIVMLAPCLSFNNLVALCCESCGRYVKDPTHPKGIRKRPPLTNIARLSCYVEKLGPHTKGIAKLRQALKYAVDGCRSPMETAIALLISLPVKYGGYGFPKPLVNWRIDLTSEQQRMAQRHYIEADLYFKDANATVEYDSDEEHSQPKTSRAMQYGTTP